MSYPLRLPASLDAPARERAERIGISFNAFICVCVDAYLNGGAPGVSKPGKPAKQAEAEPARDWRHFHPDSDSWPYVDPEFEVERVQFDEGDDGEMRAMEALYWSTRQRPGEDGAALGHSVGAPPPSSPGKKNFTKAQRKARQQR